MDSSEGLRCRVEIFLYGFAAVHAQRAGLLEAFLFFSSSFFDFLPIRELFGMAARPRSRPLGVDQGPGRGCPEGVPGAPKGFLKVFELRQVKRRSPRSVNAIARQEYRAGLAGFTVATGALQQEPSPCT